MAPRPWSLRHPNKGPVPLKFTDKNKHVCNGLQVLWSRKIYIDTTGWAMGPHRVNPCLFVKVSHSYMNPTDNMKEYTHTK